MHYRYTQYPYIYIYTEYPLNLLLIILSQIGHHLTHQNQHPGSQRIPQLRFQHSVPNRPMDLCFSHISKSPSFDTNRHRKQLTVSTRDIFSALCLFSSIATGDGKEV